MGYDVVREDDKVRRVIGYVPQEFSVWMDLTGYENLLIYSKVYGVTGNEARRIKHNRTELYTRAIQPILWLVVFGPVMARVRALPTNGIPYVAFITPGVIMQSYAIRGLRIHILRPNNSLRKGVRNFEEAINNVCLPNVHCTWQVLCINN
ncbi:hypothetical protein [Vulcanisaeta moutnovskia]|uniref:hypothetical protein n=1 Tax=Vulcanisaeta moutnovskia TaxID=985052 RepID=UPI001ED941E6|nr:hypothetical protein [Vulcanisaeta moutnovskia]